MYRPSRQMQALCEGFSNLGRRSESCCAFCVTSKRRVSSGGLGESNRCRMSTAAITMALGKQADRADLGARLRDGEPGAFESLVSLYQGRIARLAYRLLGWSGDVDDVVQEVFLAALRNAGSFRGEASLWTWLTRITLNRCRTHQRRRLM